MLLICLACVIHTKTGPKQLTICCRDWGQGYPGNTGTCGQTQCPETGGFRCSSNWCLHTLKPPSPVLCRPRKHTHWEEARHVQDVELYGLNWHGVVRATHPTQQGLYWRLYCTLNSKLHSCLDWQQSQGGTLQRLIGVRHQRKLPLRWGACITSHCFSLIKTCWVLPVWNSKSNIKRWLSSLK